MPKKESSKENLTSDFSIVREVGLDEVFVFQGREVRTFRPRHFSGSVVLRSTVAIVQMNEPIPSVILSIDPELQPLALSSKIAERQRVGEAVVSQVVEEYLAGELNYSESAYSAYLELMNNPEEMARLRKISVEAR